MSWGATSKEVDDVSFVDEIPRVLKNFKVCLLNPHIPITTSHHIPLSYLPAQLQPRTNH